MTKKKFDLLRTSENKRISPYGEYFISVKKIDVLRQEQENYEMLAPVPFPSLSYPMLIRVVFETDKEYFNKSSKGRWVHNIPLSVNAYSMKQNLYHFDISIYFPSLTPLNILNKRSFVRLLLEDKEINEILSYLFNEMPSFPGSPPVSAFDSFLKRQVGDIETRFKLQIDYPISFEYIEDA